MREMPVSIQEEGDSLLLTIGERGNVRVSLRLPDRKKFGSERVKFDFSRAS